MSIRFACPKCRQHFQVPDALAGRKGRCSKCGEMVLMSNPHDHTNAVIAGPAHHLASDTLRYETRTTLFGNTNVLYHCQKCGHALESPIKDAGNADVCPHCQAAFVIPGNDEKKNIAHAKVNDKHRRARIRREEAERKKERLQERQRQQQAKRAEPLVLPPVYLEEQHSKGTSQNTRNCPQCSAEIPKTARKCMYCGSKVSEKFAAATLCLIWLFFILGGMAQRSPSAIVIGTGVLVFVAAVCFKPLRKALGLCSIILGIIACLTGIGIIIGIPMIIVGGVFLFI